MTDNLNIAEMLAAFWHRTRGEVVPLTASEWALRTGITPRQRATIRGRRLVNVERLRRREEPIYQLSKTGIDLLRRHGLTPMARPQGGAQ